MALPIEKWKKTLDDMKRCAACRAPSCTLKCGKCKKVVYCSGACQRKHWPKHKATCIEAEEDVGDDDDDDEEMEEEEEAVNPIESMVLPFARSCRAGAGLAAPFLEEERVWQPCDPKLLSRPGGGGRLSSYPKPYLRFANRVLERNEAALASALGVEWSYTDVPLEDSALPARRFQGPSLESSRVLSTHHPEFINPKDGSVLVDLKKLRAACGRKIIAFFGCALQKPIMAQKSITLPSCFRACPSLICVCLGECPVSVEAMKALPGCLRSLRLSECRGLDDAVLKEALLLASLRYLDVETSIKGTQLLREASTVKALASSKLRLLRLADKGVGGGLVHFENLAAALKQDISAHLETLHLDTRYAGTARIAPPSLLAAIEGCSKLVDLDGIRPGRTQPPRNLNRGTLNTEELAYSSNIIDLFVFTIDLRLLNLKPSMLPAFSEKLLKLTFDGFAFVKGELTTITERTPNLESLGLDGSLEMGDFYSVNEMGDYDGAAGYNDDDLHSLVANCPKLAVLNLSGASDSAYASFSEACVACVAEGLENLTDLYLYRNGRKWNFDLVPSFDGRLRVHHDGSHQCGCFQSDY